jgi:phosphatidate cytidylyltransferase
VSDETTEQPPTDGSSATAATDGPDVAEPADGVATTPSTDLDVGRPGGRNLPVAIVVGVALAALFLWTLFTDPLLFSGMIVLATMFAVWETGTTLGSTERTVARPVLLVTAVVLGAATYVLGPQGQTLGLLVLVLGAFGWELAAEPRQDSVGKLSITIFLGAWIVFLASFAILLITREDDGVAAMLAVGGGAILGDVGAYAVGSLVGRTKIAPSVSPSKTWEGLIGGIVTSAVLGALVLPRVDPELFASPADAAIIAAVAALAGFFGDLSESMVKRDLGLKDLGRMLPGHGGVLDRVDGLLLALPVGYYALELVT